MSQELSGRRLLIIDDDPGLLRLLERVLGQEGYQIETANNGLAGLRAFYHLRPDAVVLDINMPEMSGWRVCQRIREVSSVPIIILTGLGDEQDVVRALDGGADEYVVKPFRVNEFLARVRALLRRNHTSDQAERAPDYVDNYLSIDMRTHRVLVDGKEVKLTPTEFRLLSTFLEHQGQVLSNRQLLERVWGWEYTDDTDYPRIYVWHLRRKIEPDPKHPIYIRTEQGLGYRFQPQSLQQPEAQVTVPTTTW